MEHLMDSALVQLLIVIVGIFIFVKFCGFAKNFALTGGVKKVIYILTAVAVVAMNYLFSGAKHGMGPEAELTDPQGMVIALAASIVMVLIFSFALMAEDK